MQIIRGIRNTAIVRYGRFAALLLCVALAASLALSAAAYAQDSTDSASSASAENAASTSAASQDVAQSAEAQTRNASRTAVRTQDPNQEVVRVGWYATPFNTIDQFGRRSGYGYEYQRKVAAYTGWTYEYVEGTWPELLKMLEQGEIDLMSDVSYKEDRAQNMLYSSLPMGTETYYLYITPDNATITTNDYTTLNGKRIGVTADSLQEDKCREWTKMHGIQAQIIELPGFEDESLQMLKNGEIDAFVTLDAYGDEEDIIPAYKIGSSDFYFAVSKARPSLLVQLDSAMSKIQDEDKYYNQKMYEKYLRSSRATSYLSTKEKDWLSKHGAIRVGYQDNYLAFCASDEETGELTGALKDFLDFASTSLENAELSFEAVAYPTASDALEALKNGEVDCMFPANLTDYDGETLGVVMTPPLMRSEMDAVVRADDQKEFIRKQDVTVAVNQGNTNYEMFLLDHYPGWQIAYFPDTPAGLEGVAAGKADCVIISNYRYNNIAKQCEKLHLATVYTGVDMDYCLAVREGDTELYSILTRIIGVVPESVTHAALTYYSTENQKVTFVDFVKDNLFVVLIVTIVVLLVILLLLLRSIRAEKKAREEERLVNDLNKRVFVDALTHVRNKGAYSDYLNQLQDRMDEEGPFEFAIGVFDCDNLKVINDEYGHDKGDEYLKAASQLICRIFDHSPVFRIGGDEFSVVLQNADYQNREELVAQFKEARKEVCAAAENEWDEVHLSMGVAVFDPSSDREVIDTVRRADKIMYEHKRIRKEARK